MVSRTQVKEQLSWLPHNGLPHTDYHAVTGNLWQAVNIFLPAVGGYRAATQLSERKPVKHNTWTNHRSLYRQVFKSRDFVQVFGTEKRLLGKHREGGH